MNPQINYFAVGVFLLFGVTMLIVLVLWLGGKGENTVTEQYMVQIRSEVNGLGNGSTVRFLGVDVGAVLEITLYTTDSPFVEVLIEVREGLPIDQTTYATLVVQGVTGIANIDLGVDPAGTGPRVTNRNGVPVIPFRETGLSAVLAGGGDITSGARQLLNQLNAWTDEENLQRVRVILADIESVTNVVAEERNQIPVMVSSLKTTISRMEDTTERLQRVVADDLPVISKDLKASSQRLASISTRVDGWLEKNEQSVDRVLGEGLVSMSALVSELRDVSSELSRLSARLREDPSRLVYKAKRDPVVVDP